MGMIVNPFRFAGLPDGWLPGGGEESGVTARYWRVRAPATQSASGYMGCSELVARRPDDTTNLSLSATITASASHGSFPVSRVKDGNNTTFWTTGSTAPPVGGHWIKLDFGSGNAEEISEIWYRARSDGFREEPTTLVVEYSSDDSSYTTYFSEVSIPLWVTSENRTFLKPGRGTGRRFWRLRCDDTHIAGDYFGGMEIEMRLTASGADQTTGLPIWSSSAASLVSSRGNAFDNNTSSQFTTGTVALPSGGHWLSIDFGADTDINEMTYKVRTDSFREDPVRIFFEHAYDRSNWETVWDATGIATWTAGETRTFTKP